MKIDFYVLETSNAQQSLRFTCQLIEKLYTDEQKQIYVQFNSRADAERFDSLLWTYRDDSFLPHNFYNQLDDEQSPITLGFIDNEIESPDDHTDVLINLSREIPAFYDQFEHVIEIIFADPLIQQLGRERYKQYRELGHNINTIKLKANET